MRGKIAAACVALAMSCSITPADAVQTYPTRDAKRIEAALAALGLPVGGVDGVWDQELSRATCAWRELTGRPVLRSWPTVPERNAIKATTALTVPKGLWVGVNVNRQCQTAYWIVKGKVQLSRIETHTVTRVETITVVPDSSTVTVDTSTVTDTATAVETPASTETRTVVTIETSTVTVTKLGQLIKRVMKVSTGQAAFPTDPGKHAVDWTYSGWWQSTIYPDGHMYRPIFFNRGQALHGSATDSLVMWYPASHGCVRMLHADVDALWAAGFSRQQIVNVYGTWQG